MEMKKIVIEVLAFGVLLASAGCVQPEMPNLSEGEIVVRLSIDGMATKAEDDVPAGYIYLLDDVSGALFNTVAIDASGTTTLNLSYFDNDAEKVKRTTVFVAAGYPMAPSPASLSDLKSKTVGASSFLDASGTKVKADPSFIMTAEGHFVKEDATHTTCNLTLKRLAAKVALELDIPASITTNGDWEFKSGTTYPATTTWKPMTSGENARVYLQNAVSNTALGAASDPAVLPTSFTTFTYDPVFMNGATVSAPFYTYPVSWTRGDEKEPFIKLILPWRYETTVKKGDKDVVVDQNVVEFYYKIMFPAGITSFEANTYYLPKVKLNILGGEAARPTVIGADGLTVMDWKGVTSSEMPAVTINPSDFLVPEKETFEVSNGNPLQIKYFASGEVNFTVKEIYKDVYTNNDTERRYIYSTYAGHTYLSTVPIQDTDAVKDRYNREFSGKDDKTGTETDWFTNSAFDTATKSGTLTLNHTLSDNFDLPNFAARPYHYEVELSLKDNSSVKKTITIIQNPPVLVKGVKSTGWVIVDNQHALEKDGTTLTKFKARSSADETPKINHQTKAVYNFPNQSQTSSASSNAWFVYDPNLPNDYSSNVNYFACGYLWTYEYLSSQPNNKCEWLLYVTVAPKNGLFVCDPRIELSLDSYLSNLMTKHRTRSGDTTMSDAIDGCPLTGDPSTISNLTSSYRPTARDRSTYIAPDFLVASSYGRASTTIYGNCFLRCAAYQEDGYPAGRWRIPTEAEIDYCINLQSNGAIPELFRIADGSGYYASSGRVRKGSGWESATATTTANIRCVYDTWYWGRDDVETLKTSDFGTDYSKPQYVWSGYMTSK